MNRSCPYADIMVRFVLFVNKLFELLMFACSSWSFVCVYLNPLHFTVYPSSFFLLDENIP